MSLIVHHETFGRRGDKFADRHPDLGRRTLQAVSGVFSERNGDCFHQNVPDDRISPDLPTQAPIFSVFNISISARPKSTVLDTLGQIDQQFGTLLPNLMFGPISHVSCGHAGGQSGHAHRRSTDQGIDDWKTLI